MSPEETLRMRVLVVLLKLAYDYFPLWFYFPIGCLVHVGGNKLTSICLTNLNLCGQVSFLMRCLGI